jgi:Protein of unknown function (DUF3618)
MTASGPADDAQELRQEIEQTREQLGETVEQLVARTDVKARARDQAAALGERVKGQASHARAQAVERARKVRDQLADQAGGTHQPTVLLDTAARRQSPARMPAVAATAWRALPEPVRQAAGKAADRTRGRRAQLVVMAGVLMAGGVALWWWRRR